MIINKENYEVWFIDHFEGNLNQDETEELYGFLENNPDKKLEFEEFEIHFVNTVDQDYQQKDKLKKKITDLGPVNNLTINEYSIAYLENDLSDVEKKHLLKTLEQDKGLKKIFDQYQLTKLKPDESIQYSQKKQLKHFLIERKTALRLLGLASAAAAIIWGLLLINPQESDQPKKIQVTGISQTNDTVQNITISRKETIAATKIPVNAIKTEIKWPVKDIYNTDTVIRKQTPVELNTLQPRLTHSIDNNWYAGIVTTNIQEKSGIQEDKANENTNEQKEKQPKMELQEINLWKLAELGIKGFNRLNETRYDFKQNYNQDGKLESVTLITEEMSITAPAI